VVAEFLELVAAVRWRILLDQTCRDSTIPVTPSPVPVPEITGPGPGKARGELLKIQ
jgi:hypothetical protein